MRKLFSEKRRRRRPSHGEPRVPSSYLSLLFIYFLGYLFIYYLLLLGYLFIYLFITLNLFLILPLPLAPAPPLPCPAFVRRGFFFFFLIFENGVYDDVNIFFEYNNDVNIYYIICNILSYFLYFKIKNLRSGKKEKEKRNRYKFTLDV